VSIDDQRDAARHLIGQPLVLAVRDPEGHRRIRRNADALATMFRTYLGYRLVVDARFARLSKAGLGPTDGRPLRRSGSKAPFSPRDYTYLALLCSVLLTGRMQVLLSAVVADVRQAAAEAGVDLGGDTLAERRALVHALRQLVDWGIVIEDAGSVADYADDPAKEALLFVERELIRHLLALPLREIDDPDDLIRAAADPGPDATRHAVRRKLVESPVVMIDGLPEPERTWLRQSQRREAQILEDNLALRLEIRAEGVAAFDPHDELTDIPFPREGSLGQAALLTVAELVAQLEPAGATVEVPPGLLQSVVQGLLVRYSRRWSKDYVEHPERLGPDVEDLLVDVGLLAREPDGSLRLRAIAARYAPEPAEIDAPPTLPMEMP
jgi:uncharacterized protein (TIGR02678 family)